MRKSQSALHLLIINSFVKNCHMAELLKNPFKFGDPVDGDHYFPRTELHNLVAQFLENRIHVVLIGPRRFGKTSFVLHLLRSLEKRSFSCPFVDIFNITSHKDFLQQMLRAIRIKKPFLSFTLDHSSDKDVKEMIQDVLANVEKLGEKVVFVIDEFQKIAEIDDGGWLEATLRTHMQQLRNVSFLFTGSRRGIIYDMLNNRARPLYRSCQVIEFPAFGNEFTDWIIQRFNSIGIACEKEAIDYLRAQVHQVPNYVQMVCFHLVAQGVKNITTKEVETTLAMVVQQNAYAYQTLLDSLTHSQQRALRLAAIEGKQVFAQEHLQKYEISSGPALASIIRSLKEKGILDEEGTGRGRVTFDDPLFAIWLKQTFAPVWAQ